MSTSPEAIFNGLLSKSDKVRDEAQRELGLRRGDLAWGDQADDVRLARVNLDEDQELEAILTYTCNRKSTIAVVFDWSGGSWWRVGEFGYWWHWDSDEAERLIELREIVWLGRKDLIVRTRSGGTGVAFTDLHIYRLHHGQLHRVFETREKGYDAAGDASSRITYQDVQTGHPAIVIERTTTTYAHDGGPEKSTKSCEAYTWQALKFTFQSDKSASRKFCSQGGQSFSRPVNLINWNIQVS